MNQINGKLQRARVTLLFDYTQNIYHASKIYAGLAELAAHEEITFLTQRPEPGLVDDYTVVLKIDQAGRQSALIAVDLRDASNIVTTSALERCDTYFKRSYYSPDLRGLPAHLRQKVLPFGLNYACSTATSRFRLSRILASENLTKAIASPREWIRRLPQHASELRNFYSLPDVREFEQSPEVELEPRLLYQTRVWPPETSADNLPELNEERVSLLRRLRAAFSDRFIGGLVPTKFARQMYPDLLTENPTRRRLYTALSKKYVIGIYTRGVHHSLAFKLPEYIAAAQCIVSEPIRNELPQPLVPGRHLLEFHTHQECIDHCNYLLDNREAATQMRRHNHDYYSQEVAPANHLRKFLAIAIQGRCLPSSTVF